MDKKVKDWQPHVSDHAKLRSRAEKMMASGNANNKIDYAMLKSINEVGQVMGMKTIAEFVESAEIKGMLEAIDVNYAQGYAIGQPIDVKALLASG